MLQNHAWVKNPFKVQTKPEDFKVTEYEKFNDSVSDFTLQLTFIGITQELAIYIEM